MTMAVFDGVQTPYPISVEREAPAAGVMSQPGDPVLDMVYSLRNIEWLAVAQHQMLKEILRRTEAEHGEPVDNSTGSKKRS